MKKYGMLLEKIASSAKESNEINISGIELTDEDKKLILTSAIQAPSAGCQLLYTILDITDQTKKDRLADLCDHQAFIAAGQMVLQKGW